MKKILGISVLFLCLSFPLAGQSAAGITTRDISYEVDGKEFIGFIAYDASLKAPRPGVIVVHEWRGINDYARKRAVDLALEGYVAFALDMYGDGEEVSLDMARSMSRSIGSDFPLLEERFNAALKVLHDQDMVDRKRTAAIGYCFGGGVVLNMARLGTGLNGVVSFHGSLNTGLDARRGDIKTRILAIQGDGDPVAPAEKQKAFKKEMEDSGAEFEYIIYRDVAAHNFTNPEGRTYHEKEADRAWDSMLDFFESLF